ncbi:MAG: hypothetical protein NTU48_04455 [Legionellales bacterium]|nr:hypothetical protein [Legionellales bacterium]
MLRRSMGGIDNAEVFEMIAKSEQYQVLTALTPGHVTRADLDQQFLALSVQNPVGSAALSYRFDNTALADADFYRAEILHNVEVVLAKYRGDVITRIKYQAKKIEKDLLWAALQSYAHLQAVEQEVGLILDPHSEYATHLKNLETCRDLLSKNGSDLSVVETLLEKKPVLSDVANGQWYERTFNDFIQYIDDRNNTRLFWVWGRPTLDLVLGFEQQEAARQRLADTTYVPGQISWSLYLFRGTLFFVKFMHKYFHTPKWLQAMHGLTPEQQAMYRGLYIKAYWDVYKYRILNDYVWGPINWAGFVLLVGPGFLGWLNDFGTCILLGMDIYLTNLGSAEKLKTFQDNQAQYIEKLTNLTQNIVAKIHNGVKKPLLAVHADFDSFSDEAKVRVLHTCLFKKSLSTTKLSQSEIELMDMLADLTDIRQAQQDHAERWRKQDQFLAFDRVYTRVLLFVFAMCVGFLLSPVLPIAWMTLFSQTGTILCMASTIVYRSACALLQIQQAKEDRAVLLTAEMNAIDTFLTLKRENSQEPHLLIAEKMENTYLSIATIGAQINYQSASIQYQYFELARTSLMRALIPVCIGLTMIYAPATLLMVPSYVFVLAASAALAYVLDRWAKAYKPCEELPAPIFKLEEYKKFVNGPRAYSHYIGDSFFYRPPTGAGESDRSVRDRNLIPC